MPPRKRSDTSTSSARKTRTGRAERVENEAQASQDTSAQGAPTADHTGRPPHAAVRPPHAQRLGEDGPGALPEDDELAGLRAVLAERLAIRDQLEALESQRLHNTCLVLQLTVISCRWAHMTWPGKRTIPVFSFPTVQCYQGKSQPDIECLRCQYVMPIRYGVHQPRHQHRYHDHGLIIPIPDEATADDLGNWLNSHPKRLRPARDVDAEITALQVAIQAKEQQMATQRRVELERSQGGRNPIGQQV